MSQAAEEKAFSELVGRIFTDEKFAQGLEHDPEKTLHDAGYHLNQHQKTALQSGKGQSLAVENVGATAAIVKPVVSVLTKGTRPAVSVVVQSAVVASSEDK